MLDFNGFGTRIISPEYKVILNELEGMIYSNYVVIPLLDNKSLFVESSLINSLLIWRIDGIWIKTNQFGYKRCVQIDKFAQGDWVITLFRKISTMTTPNAIRLIELEYNKSLTNKY